MGTKTLLQLKLESTQRFVSVSIDRPWYKLNMKKIEKADNDFMVTCKMSTGKTTQG